MKDTRSSKGQKSQFKGQLADNPNAVFGVGGWGDFLQIIGDGETGGYLGFEQCSLHRPTGCLCIAACKSGA